MFFPIGKFLWGEFVSFPHWFLSQIQVIQQVPLIHLNIYIYKDRYIISLSTKTRFKRSALGVPVSNMGVGQNLQLPGWFCQVVHSVHVETHQLFQFIQLLAPNRSSGTPEPLASGNLGDSQLTYIVKGKK